MVVREIERIGERLRQEYGYVPPLRAKHINEARERVGRILGIELTPIAPFGWECAPHDDAEMWPALYARAVDELRFTGRDPDTDPESRCAAEDMAAAWLHGLASRAS
jgi:hypothetical protein